MALKKKVFYNKTRISFVDPFCMLNTPTHQETAIALLKKISLGILSIAILGFVGLKVYPILHGPQIHLSTLSDGANLEDPMVSISGKALFTKNLIVNGAVLPIAPDGTFHENLLLVPGYNLITLQAQDRFGSTLNKNYALLLSEEKNQTFTVRFVEPYAN